MKEVLETTQLEYDKSGFLIDLVRHETGKFYIEIIQTIHTQDESPRSIKINPELLSDIMKVLQNYQAKITTGKVQPLVLWPETDQEQIVKRYLKGVSIKDLSLQFEQSQELITMILRNKGIEIVPNKMPTSKKWKRWKRKK